jgi:hypothetical protein
MSGDDNIMVTISGAIREACLTNTSWEEGERISNVLTEGTYLHRTAE